MTLLTRRLTLSSLLQVATTLACVFLLHWSWGVSIVVSMVTTMLVVCLLYHLDMRAIKRKYHL